ncbi:LysR substrate-binding domain-containing protein [Sphingorhabdus sp. Alg231-15]|uniref:LysR substrate-binding domain-containing protein n=1 Tax=Sphingorhabdus sp. Alg231-15 TaxID=1922222 RepID=UPI000D56148B
MSKYEEIETFVRVVEAGSITGAAEQLHIAKSAVSRRLKELETRLGVQLMQRTTRKLSLTDTGEALYQRSISLLADWAETESATINAQTALAGIVRVAAPLSFGVAHLGPAILDFMKVHPDVEFDINFSDRKMDLVADGMDLAIRIGDLPDSSLIARKIASITMVAAASRSYLEQHGYPETPDDLKNLKELRYGYRRTPSWKYRAPDQSEGQVEMAPRLLATNGDFLRDAAVAGEGVIIEPRFIVYEHLEAGSLVEILPDYEWPKLTAYAVYPPTRHLSARVRTFVDFLVERYRGTPYWEKG